MVNWKVPMWIDSIRSITTFQIVSTYCLIMLSITIASIILMCQGKFDGAKDIIVFIVGNFTGTALGSIVAYHFKKHDTNGEEIKK